MSVALAEAAPHQYFFPVQKMSSEKLDQKRAEWLFHGVGKTAIVGAEESQESAADTSQTNLLSMMKRAVEHDPEADAMLTTNIHTDVFERTIKAGFVLSVPLEHRDGVVLQHGQTDEEIQSNTLGFINNNLMQPRFEAETRNMYRLRSAIKQGLLKDYYFVVFSRCPDGVSDAELDRAGFFSHTKSMAVQVTGTQNGDLQVESAFVAGCDEKTGKRQDKKMIQGLGDRLGIDLGEYSTETLDRPVLIHKSMMPNGVVDLVEMLDESLDTFFGQKVPRKNYVAFRQECKKREEEMKPLVEKIKKELLARAHTVKTPLEATQLLDIISAKHTLEHAVEDHRIDPRVYGQEAAWHLQFARSQSYQGNIEQMRVALHHATRTQTSSSCPTGSSKNSDTEGALKDIGDISSAESGEEKLEDCDFISKECPKCGAKNVKTQCRGGKYYGECGCHS